MPRVGSRVGAARPGCYARGSFYLDCVTDGRDERQKKNGLYYTTTSADGRAIALLSLSGSSKGEATLCWRLSVQKNPKRRRGAFPGVQHMGGVVDKGCG